MPFKLTLDKLIYGGEALGHHEGRTVLVPRVLPGELVEVEETRTAKGVTRARPLRIVTVAPDRVEPPCRYFGECGGCHYQHVNIDRQPEHKREILRETLRRIGKIVWENEIPVHASNPWNYRNQAQFKISHTAERTELGFYAAESHRLVPVDECKILSPRLNAAISALRAEVWPQDFAACREIELLADDKDEKLMLTLHGDIEPEVAQRLAGHLGKLPGVVSVAVKRDNGFDVFGDPALTYQVEDFRYRVSPGSFFQVSRYLLAELVQAVTGGVEGTFALDLFAGVGLFSLPLARAFKEVIAVEGNTIAAADLAANAQSYQLSNVRAQGASLYDFLRRFARSGPDLVVLDPPRAGVGEHSLKLLAGLRPARLHYLSCHPPTLARDLAHLTHLGYTIISIAMFDLFPQTSHIECLAQLVRNDRKVS
ncbi:MAG: class I SAM-dependent RNA methyltransferase [Deltaproteobacteria bacterium]